MSTRERLFSALNLLTDEQVEAIYAFLQNISALSREPNEETQLAMKEADRIAHDTTVKGFDDIMSLREALDAE